ncbi:integral membrane protein-like protein [Corynespora cassiicola Philippines]|uniref:Integral membrane protein-like protein n=1 Tax=Corynespora cassiicola Philippines TaxID=1448308 RepID=A0A2T2NUP9_CORCC|nr:integral membrane protein-like protein [Corynespora cassiicola Philippines]
MATTPEAQEAAAKERIIKHMNADHSDSIRRYLEAFQEKSIFDVKNAQLTDISLTEMKFTCGGQQSVIPFDPPMKSLREARERLVQLDKDALKILGRSDISITNFIPPYANPLHLFNFCMCLFGYWSLSSDANFQPGSLLFDNALYRAPDLASFILSKRSFVLGIMVAIHAFEASLMTKKLAKHGVAPYQGVWWAWIMTCFVEGFTSFNRINKFVREKQAEKEAKKH